MNEDLYEFLKEIILFLPTRATTGLVSGFSSTTRGTA
jgi:hypothetical protein